MTTLEFKITQILLKLGLLPRPTNKRLKDLFEGIDRIMIKNDGVWKDKAMSDTVALTITDGYKLARFSELLEIDEPKIVSYCMCVGSYAIELYAGQKRKATIGFHHGSSIRYHKWHGDAMIRHGEQLAAFLDDEGLPGPLLERMGAGQENAPAP